MSRLRAVGQYYPCLLWHSMVLHTSRGRGQVIMMTRSGMVTEYYFYCERARTHRKVEGLVLLVFLITGLLHIWLTDNLTQFKCGLVICTRSYQLDMVPIGYGNATKKNNTIALFNTTVNQWGFPEWEWGRATQGLI